MNTFAFFITPHGYGHAARAAAVMMAIRQIIPDAHFEVYTKVPAWLFEKTLLDREMFSYHELNTDLGLVQNSVMEENLPETLRRLGEMLPFHPDVVDPLAVQIKGKGCQVVLCDIAPLGIAVAQAAGLPAVLIENFTWDWIYEGYLDREPGLAPYITYLHDQFASVRYHIRTEPACSYEMHADLTTHVAGRPARISRCEMRAALGVPEDIPLILITMGGIGSQYPFLNTLEKYSQAIFIIPGPSQVLEKRGSLVLMPHQTEFYHPDLVEASDGVIGKLGYSTLAETFLSGVPYGFIPRLRFRESDVMKTFVLEKMNGIEIPEDRFYSGEWLEEVPRLLSIPRSRPTLENGAMTIAKFIAGL